MSHLLLNLSCNVLQDRFHKHLHGVTLALALQNICIIENAFMTLNFFESYFFLFSLLITHLTGMMNIFLETKFLMMDQYS